jgi:hypothetical protein
MAFCGVDTGSMNPNEAARVAALNALPGPPWSTSARRRARRVAAPLAVHPVQGGADRPDGERGQIPTVWPPSMTMA